MLHIVVTSFNAAVCLSHTFASTLWHQHVVTFFSLASSCFDPFLFGIIMLAFQEKIPNFIKSTSINCRFEIGVVGCHRVRNGQFVAV